MNNIKLKKKPQRSVQSLIDDSVLDQEYNYQAVQLRKAYNETIRTLKRNETQLVKEKQYYIEKIQKLTQQMEFRDKIIRQLHGELDQLQTAKDQLEKIYKIKTDRLFYVQRKLAKLVDNRQTVQHVALQQNINQVSEQTIFETVRSILNHKIKQFTIDMRQFKISQEVQRRIQSFLEQLLFISPQSSNGFNRGAKPVGKILIMQNGQAELKRLQKSIEKLKVRSSNRKHEHKSPIRSPLKSKRIFQFD